KRAHAPAKKERAELPDADDVRAGEDDGEPADDGKEVRDGTEQPAFTTHRQHAVLARSERPPEGSAADEDDVRNRQEEPEERRQTIAVLEQRLHRHADWIGHRALYNK